MKESAEIVYKKLKLIIEKHSKASEKMLEVILTNSELIQLDKKEILVPPNTLDKKYVLSH